jgi:antitoxin CcdA
MAKAHRSPARSRKVPTNLSVSAHLVLRAKSLGINLSDALEEALEEKLLKLERESWLEANQEAIRGFNEHITREGAFSDGWRSF